MRNKRRRSQEVILFLGILCFILIGKTQERRDDVGDLVVGNENESRFESFKEVENI